MPWNIKERDGEFCVVKEDGTQVGCHGDEQGAKEQISALKAGESKKKEWVPTGIYSYEQLAADREMREAKDAIFSEMDTFLGLVDNVGWSDDLDIKQKAQMVIALSGEFGRRVGAVAEDAGESTEDNSENGDSEVSEASRNVAFAPYKNTKEEGKSGESAEVDVSSVYTGPRGTSFAVTKDKSGDLRWIAVYTNNFRDRDGEIIAKEGHEKFVDLLDAGLVEYPELWYWHIPGTAIGVADMIENVHGFGVASGTFYEEHTDKALRLSEDDSLGVSHGMPVRFIVRDESDPTIITRHVTTEISVLPHSAASNDLTGFHVKGDSMSELTAQKLAGLRDKGWSEDEINGILAQLKSTSDEASEAGRESKEAQATEAQEEAAPAVEGDDVEDDADSEADASVGASDDTKESDTTLSPEVIGAVIKEAVASAMAERDEQISSLTKQVGLLAVHVAEGAVRKDMKPRSAEEILRDEVLGSPFTAESEVKEVKGGEGPRENNEVSPLYNAMPGGGFVGQMIQANQKSRAQ